MTEMAEITATAAALMDGAGSIVSRYVDSALEEISDIDCVLSAFEGDPDHGMDAYVKKLEDHRAALIQHLSEMPKSALGLW